MAASQIKSLNQVQIVVAVLIGGVLMLGGVLVWLRLNQPSTSAGAASGEFLLIVTAIVWFGGFIGSLVMRAALIAPIRREADAGRPPDEASVLARFANLAIIRGALLEGPGLLGCVAYLLTGQWPVLVAPALSILVMAAQFPSRGAFQSFVRDATGRAGHGA